jgi:EAL domain-containing protein (putative c-di-GMP-specific phosphodiesterase class I)
MIMPADFIPAAEQSCLMRDLTAYVVDAALAQAARWRQDGLPVQVSVNLCARDLLDGGLAEMVGRGLQRHGLLPGELMLEINEAALADGPPRGTGALAALAALGVPLSLDDFGTGSSLVGLRRLPVSEIKIDASVTAAVRRPGHQADREVAGGSRAGAGHPVGGRRGGVARRGGGAGRDRL